MQYIYESNILVDNFSFRLVEWYDKHQRQLPWRNSTDAYTIWLSEVILQQTRVAQGLPYFLKFIEAYPTVADMAAADEQAILRLWQGLGYYSRARNMHFTAQYIVKELAGKFPTNYADLLKLKGIGKYTAAAIASFAFGEAVAVVDGNVYRVLARVFGIEDDITNPQGQRHFAALAQELLDKNKPSAHNQALMEFGALHCKPAAPLCDACLFQPDCVAFALKKQRDLPVKSKKINIKKRYFHYFLVEHQEQFLMKPRHENDIWQGLYDFPLQEHKKIIETDNYTTDFEVVSHSKTYQHILTHQKISAVFTHLKIENPLAFETFKAQHSGAEAYTSSEIEQLPKPILIVNFITQYLKI